MISVFKELKQISRAAAEFIQVFGNLCIKNRNRFDLVLAGGNTPAGAYSILAENTKSKTDFWRGTHLWWGDERCVPPDSDMSNYRLAKNNLIDIVNPPEDNVHRIPAEMEDRQQAAQLYSDQFPAQPDLVLLGMGTDGHTASLFPDSDALNEKERLFVPSESPVEPRRRITMTPVALASAKKVLVLVAGQNKSQVVERVFSQRGDINDTPARLLRNAMWFLDEKAAGDIEKLIDSETSATLFERVR